MCTDLIDGLDNICGPIAQKCVSSRIALIHLTSSIQKGFKMG